MKKKTHMGYGLLTLTCQVARRQEASGVGGGAVRGGGRVARAYQTGDRKRKCKY